MAEYLHTTVGYLINGEISIEMDQDEKEILSMFKCIENPKIRKVALEQLYIISKI